MPVRFDTAQSRIAEVAAVTGQSPDNFTVTVVPTFDVTGTVDGQPVDAMISQPLTFHIAGNVIQVEGTLRHTEPAVADGAATVSAPNDVSVFGATMTVSDARRFSLAAIAGLLLVAAGLAWFGWGRRPEDRIRAMYRSRLVDVAESAADTGQPIPVTSFNELRRLATRDDRMILHQVVENGAHRYFLPDGDLTYEYVLGGAPVDIPASELLAEDVASPRGKLFAKGRRG